MSAFPVPRRILVIGGGPSGLVTLRNIRERGNFNHVELYERRDDVGGVWFLDEGSDTFPVSDNPRWPSPAYRGMIGNVLPEFLSFSEHPFPASPTTPHQPFPTLKETHNYLKGFATPYIEKGVIKLNREVVRVEELPSKRGWNVVTRNWNHNGKEEDEIWDAVVVAVGWYDNPVWPDTDGLEELKARGIAKHAKSWRGPESYVDKKVLVVGNANSSNDIAAQLASVANKPIYQSIRRPAFPGFVSLPDERIKMVAPVSKYTAKDTGDGGKADAHLSDGTVITDLDVVHIGTGYKIMPSFVYVLEESKGTLAPIANHDTKPHRVPSLHRLILYAHNPSLAFIGAPMSYTPFTIADVASTWLTLAWTGEASYPDTVDGRLAFERERMAAIDQWRNQIENPSALMVYNVLGHGEQEYARSLKEDIVKARPELHDALPEWNDERTALREAMHRTKLEALKYAKEHNAIDHVP
ncbi:Thiol-specific monooxygenase [Psilocybe cubensis]|uniref:Thiol-specific monooxygenase n=2 Tax=Psilocybe cubensis TaxID=181762 RepID=A0ACB8GJF1_PSICU|nr:Thiol-specific monooxygenase [Psilocybe cubensis]KAH9475734.1 Thiol-specific monooxygenase [Psilocybe cubensis]